MIHIHVHNACSWFRAAILKCLHWESETSCLTSEGAQDRQTWKCNFTGLFQPLCLSFVSSLMLWFWNHIKCPRIWYHKFLSAEQIFYTNLKWKVPLAYFLVWSSMQNFRKTKTLDQPKLHGRKLLNDLMAITITNCTIVNTLIKLIKILQHLQGPPAQQHRPTGPFCQWTWFREGWGKHALVKSKQNWALINPYLARGRI